MASFNKKKYPLGLNITSNFLKIVQLKLTRNKITIQALGKAHLKTGLIKNGVIINKKELANLIKKLINNPSFGNFNTNEVVACLPIEKTYIKLIHLEKSPNQIADVIGSEIEKHIPVSTEETYYDWQLIKTNNDLHSILIGAAPREIVDQYIDLLELAGLSVNALEIESIPIARALLIDENPKNANIEKTKNYAIINIGKSRSNITIYCQGTIVLSISIPFSSNEITKEIAKALSISESQAQKAKIVCGLDSKNAEGIICELILKHFKELTKHINKIIKFYLNNHQELGDLNELIACGEGSKIKNVEQIISKETGYKTIIGNSATNLDKIPSKISNHTNSKKSDPKKQDLITDYSTAIGLALRDIFFNKV